MPPYFYISLMITLRLKELLRRKKISHRKFAEMIKIDRGTLARYLRGDGNPTLSTLEKFAKALNVKIKDLIKE